MSLKVYLLVIYMICTIASLFASTSEGYESLLWKFYIGQVIIIPFMIIIGLSLKLLIRRDKKREKSVQ